VLVHFTGFDSAHAWSLETAARQLDGILRPTVLLESEPARPSRQARRRLQQLIGEWPYLRHRAVLETAAAELLAARVRFPVELIALVDDYIATLNGYVVRRDRAGLGGPPLGVTPADVNRLARSTTESLDDLDRRRALIVAGKEANNEVAERSEEVTTKP